MPRIQMYLHLFVEHAVIRMSHDRQLYLTFEDTSWVLEFASHQYGQFQGELMRSLSSTVQPPFWLIIEIIAGDHSIMETVFHPFGTTQSCFLDLTFSFHVTLNWQPLPARRCGQCGGANPVRSPGKKKYCLKLNQAILGGFLK